MFWRTSTAAANERGGVADVQRATFATARIEEV
jgi:hypothetical protein